MIEYSHQQYKKNSQNNWFIYWIIFCAIITNLIVIIIRHGKMNISEIVITSIISIIIGAILGLIGKKIYNTWNNRYPFKIYLRDNNRLLNKLVINGTGEHEKILVVKPRCPIDINRFWFYFTSDKKRPTPTSVPKTIVEITKLIDLDYQEGKFPKENEFISVTDTIGIDGIYSQPYHRASYDKIKLKIIIDTKSQWQGYLAFCSYGCDGQRHYTYLDIEVKMEQNEKKNN